MFASRRVTGLHCHARTSKQRNRTSFCFLGLMPPKKVVAHLLLFKEPQSKLSRPTLFLRIL